MSLTFEVEGLRFCSGPLIHDPLPGPSLPESPLYFRELSGKTKNMPSALQNETLSVCEVNRVG